MAKIGGTPRAKRRLLTSLLRWRSGTDILLGPELALAVVGLLNHPRGVPQSPIQQALLRALKETSSVSLPVLVKRVVGELYRDELRQGAAALDIGLFGDRLFNRDVVRELEAGNGILWEIISQREPRS
jgi:hypothetical protein